MALTLRHSPSLVSNNLSSAVFGDRGGFRLCYVHKDELIIVESKTGSGFERTVKLDLKNTQVFCASFVGFAGGGGGRGISSGKYLAPPAEYLVLCSNQGAQLWSVDGERMEWFHQLCDLLEDGTVSADAMQLQFMRGACGFQSSLGVSCLALGSSVGTVYVINTAGDVLHRLSTQSSAAISATASSARSVFCANDDGDILGFRVHDNFDTFLRMPGRGEACTALCCKGDVVIAGFVTGHIRVIRAELGELAIELAAHSRCLTALSLFPSGGAYIASVGEDQLLHVWSCPDFLTPSGSDMDLGFASRLEHCLCTGVSWLPDGRLLVASFDEENLVVFNPETRALER